MSAQPPLSGNGARAAHVAPLARELPRATTRPVRPVLDVRDLPTIVYGDRGLVWWGTIGFMVVETMTFACTIVAYFYLRRNFTDWPPVPSPLPPLWLGSVSLLVLIANAWPTWMFDRAGKRRDAKAAARWLWVSAAIMLVGTLLRIAELRWVGARWDEHAYGSVVWAILGFHFTLIAVDTIETAGLASFFTFDRYEEKHFVDATDNAFYTWYSIASWIPGFVTIYLVPRWW
jgi:cytochrome c oxidase subunit 3